MILIAGLSLCGHLAIRLTGPSRGIFWTGLLGGLAGTAGAAQARVLVLGVTFKEDCPDLRNSRGLDLVQMLAAAGAQVDAFDPWADPRNAHDMGGVELVKAPQQGVYDAVVLAVAHQQFRAFDAAQIRALGVPDMVVYDVKSAWPRQVVDDRL